MKLVVYNPEASCPKCGCDDVRTGYQEQPQAGIDWWWLDFEHEHLIRTCQRCHYDWPERCTKKRAKPGVTP